MKSAMRSIGILTLLTVTILSSSIHSSDDETSLKLSIGKPAYLLREPIWLDITFTNTSSDTLRTYGLVAPNHRGFTIELTDVNGVLLEYTGFSGLFGDIPGKLLLQPGEQDYGSFNLMDLFGVLSLSGPFSWRFPIIPTGTYTVQSQYQGVISNEQTFEIVEPSGEEKQALELIKEANRIWDRDDRGPSAQLFQRVVDEFPNSVYAKRCLYFALSYSNAVVNAKSQGTYDDRKFHIELLARYPNSGDSKFWFVSATRGLDEDQKLELAKKLAEEHPNTRLSKYVTQIRRRILNKKEGE